jgi:hypothetical protein
MTEENKETAPTTMEVELGGGIKTTLPIDDAKKYIERQNQRNQEHKQLKEEKEREAQEARAAKEKAALLEKMKQNDIDGVKSEVSKEYKDTISQLQSKVYGSEIKNQLRALEVVDGSLDDIFTQIKASAAITLEADIIKIDGKPANEYLNEWVKNRPHFVKVKTQQQQNVKSGGGGKAPDVVNEKAQKDFIKGLFNK